MGKNGGDSMSWQEFHAAIQEAYHMENEETVIKIPFENIVDVNSEYLIYQNLAGETETISLEDCVHRFNLALGEEPKNRAGETIKIVGGRFFSRSKSGAFYEFFTEEHHTRFCMYIKQTPFKNFLRRIGWGVDNKAFSEFYSLQKKLNSLGYSAIDLT